MSQIWTLAEIELAKLSPTSHFHGPKDVVSTVGLSVTDKIAILNQWEIDARALQRASEENMGGGESPLLDEVHAALNTMQWIHNSRHVMTMATFRASCS
jgi:hypothetical protein